LITFPHVTGLTPTAPAQQEHGHREDPRRTRHRGGGQRGLAALEHSGTRGPRV